MLLETSFCGPKPLDAANALPTVAGDSMTTDELEQIILARKHDFTKSVLPEGINIDLSTPKKTKSEAKTEANGSVENRTEKPIKRTQIVIDKNVSSSTRTNNQPKKGGVLKKNNCTVVGVTPSGTQVYIFIKYHLTDLYLPINF